MNYVYNILDSMKYFYSSMNPAMLSGAIDVCVVEQPDGTYLCTPFHVRFGKLAVFNVDDKYVDIQINNRNIDSVKMKLGDNGVAFFVEEIKEDEELPDYLLTSPIETTVSSSSDESEDDRFFEEQRSPRKKVSVIIIERDKISTSKGKIETSIPKKSLSYSSSIFSCRKNRSLPDLSLLDKSATFKAEEITKSKHGNENKEGKKSTQLLENCALSDSEVDSNYCGSPNIQYGLKDETNSKENIPQNSGYRWNWFGWRSSKTNKDHLKPSELIGVSYDSGYYEGGLEDMIEENVAEQMSKPNVPNRVKEEAPTRREVHTALKKADIVEKQMLAGTKENGMMAVSTFKADVHKNLEKHTNSVPRLTLKTRSTSGTSVKSNVSFDSGTDFYTSLNNGRPTCYKRTLRLESSQLKNLNLEHGMNEARFSISTKFQGTAWCACHIYLLKYNEKIVISDIDGTITKSDVLGHIIPAIGGTWAHTNIVDLYGRIQNNGYRIIYLSSRAIGQSYQTKRYLSSVIQKSKTLPDGPVLLSPTSVLMALRKEVIERKPEEFKIACLSDLMSLFPTRHPFYAGFGNRETDSKSYLAVGIPAERILIIDPTGNVRNAAYEGFKTNYDTMLKDQVVDYFFPPLNSTKNKEDDNSFSSNYWREQPVEIDDVEMERYEKNRRQKQLEEMKRKKQLISRTRYISV